MPNYKLSGQPASDSPTDDSGGAGTSPQQGGGNPAPDAALSGPDLGCPSIAPGSIAFVSDDGAPAPTSDATNGPVTTQIVTFANSGIVFNNSYTGNVTAAYQSCILSAEQQIASTWTNNVTISVEFDAQAEGTNGSLASNNFFIVNESYTSLKSALSFLASTEPGNTILQEAVAHLPTTDPSGGKGFALPLPYAQILGFSIPSNNPEDTVTLNTSYNWNYGQDVINTLEHEVSEGGMGRIGGLGDQNHFWSMMDLFRYNSSSQPDYTDGRDGQTTFFSYNGGATLSKLSFNNEFNSSNVKVNGGDTADFTQQDVFGTGNPGETNALSQTDIQIMDALGWSPTVQTTAEMIAHDSSNNYYIYDIGQNALQSSATLGNLGTTTFGGIGNFGGDKGDVMLRSSAGDLIIYDISNNQITATHDLGNVGPDWTIGGFGNFSGNPSETDLIMRQSSGDLEVYDISNNQVTFATSLGNFGSNSVAGFGDFSGHAGETDMMMRSSTGDLIVYDMGKNSITSGPINLGNVGLDWTIYGFGDFSSYPNETDLIMRSTTTQNFELYDISNNRVVSAEALGNVGPEWTIAGFGNFSGNPGETDMMLRDTNNGAFEVYDFANNRIYNATSGGQVTLSRSVSGVGPNDPGADISLSTSANTIGQSQWMNAVEDEPQVTLINDEYEIAPVLDDLVSQASPTAGVDGAAGAMNAGAGQGLAAGAMSGLSDLVPPMGGFFSAPAEFSQAPAEPTNALPIFGAGVLQHTV